MRRRFMSVKGFNEIFDINNYLTVEAIEDGLTVSFENDIEYGIDGKGWIKLKKGANSPKLKAGQTISFKGKLNPVTSLGVGTFTISKKCNLFGNVMSLLFAEDAMKQKSLIGYEYAFYELFFKCPIISVASSFLPATTLASSCYMYMFRGCTSLTTAPELPATTLASSCYSSMFSGCSILTTVPTLSATTLASDCYNSMFNGCSSLTTAPELPATTLASSCYMYMFRGCKSLTTAPELPATTLAIKCYDHMFSGCTSLTTASELPATTLANDCYAYMFYGCTNLTSAPELPATTLASYCYSDMFYGCTGLTTAPELLATTLAGSCYCRMFYRCNKLNHIKMLATNISATYCLSSWVYDVASTGTFVKHPNMTSLPTGTDGIPKGWTVVNDGEESNGDGDKVVNKVQLVNDGFEWDFMFDYPVNSMLQINFADGLVYVSKGSQQSSTGYPSFDDKPTIVGIDPLEDDKYIYTW